MSIYVMFRLTCSINLCASKTVLPSVPYPSNGTTSTNIQAYHGDLTIPFSQICEGDNTFQNKRFKEKNAFVEHLFNCCIALPQETKM